MAAETSPAADAEDVAVSKQPESAPSLDTSIEPWVGDFPGLGSMEVAADGSYVVMPAPSADEDSESLASREEALRYGWAELLAWARRGYPRATGLTLGIPGEGTCVVLRGDVSEVGGLLRPMIDAGFAVLADRPAPVRWEGEQLIAEPCPRPVVVSRAKADSDGFQWRLVRGDTDTCAIEVPRLDKSCRVAAVLSVAMRRPHEDAFEMLSGHSSFEAAANLMAAGILDPEVAAALARGEDPANEGEDAEDLKLTAAEVAQRMTTHLRLASIPAARLFLEADDHAEALEVALPWLGEALAS